MEIWCEIMKQVAKTNQWTFHSASLLEVILTTV
jgi:hypothetical protein